MKKKIGKIFAGAILAQSLISILCLIYIAITELPDKGKQAFISILIGPIFFISLSALIISSLASGKLYQAALKPLRSMLEYLDALLSGKFTGKEPDLKEEEELSSFMETNADKAVFLSKLANVRAGESMRREFSANVSHELKSPLTSINGYAEMIESGMADLENSKRFAGIIKKEGNRLLEMINEIIELSQFDSGYLDNEKKEIFDLSALASKESESLRAGALKRGVDLYLSLLPSDRPIEFFGNERLMGDLIRNLLSNAVKYSKAEGGRVDLRIEDADKEILIEVKDRGIGIGEEDKERIFERFYVASQGRSRESGGTGLGLSLVKHITKIHKGEIRLESSIGKGSSFSLAFPKQDTNKIKHNFKTDYAGADRTLPKDGDNNAGQGGKDGKEGRKDGDGPEAFKKSHSGQGGKNN